MDAQATTLWSSVATLVVALVMALVRRLRSGKRVLPRARLRVQLSLQTPESDRPGATAADDAADHDPRFRGPLDLSDRPEPLELDDPDARDTTPPPAPKGRHGRRRR